MNSNTCPCDSGYLDVSGTCTQCTLPCSACSPTLTYCTACYDGLMTKSSGVCTCPSNYYLNNTYNCIQCTLHAHPALVHPLIAHYVMMQTCQLMGVINAFVILVIIQVALIVLHVLVLALLALHLHFVHSVKTQEIG